MAPIHYTDSGLNVCSSCAPRYTIVDGNEGFDGFVCESPEHESAALTICAYCGETITDLQSIEYGLTDAGEIAYVSHTADYHNERVSLLRESARIIGARKWS